MGKETMSFKACFEFCTQERLLQSRFGFFLASSARTEKTAAAEVFSVGLLNTNGNGGIVSALHGAVKKRRRWLKK